MTDYKDLIERLRSYAKRIRASKSYYVGPQEFDEVADALEAQQKELNELWDSIIISPVKPPEDNQ